MTHPLYFDDDDEVVIRCYPHLHVHVTKHCKSNR